MVHVLLVAENWVTRTALRSVLDDHPEFAVVAETASDDEAVTRTNELSPDVVVVDAEHSTCGHAVVRLVSACRDSGARVLVRASDGTSVPVEINGESVAWLWHDASAEEFVAAVRLSASGYLVRPSPAPTQAAEPTRPKLLDVLTARESEVLRLLAKGLTNAEISATLSLGESTIKTYVQNVLSKLGVRNRVTAAIYAYEVGVAGVGLASAGDTDPRHTTSRHRHSAVWRGFSA